jgi:hypothetical protein
MAEALNVSVDDLVGTNGTRKRGAGPTGQDEAVIQSRVTAPA